MVTVREEQILANEHVISIVNEFKARPVLWDPKNDLYSVNRSRAEAWSELASMFDYTVDDLKRKFRSIFASHRSQRSRVQKGIKSFWYLYDHLSFLPSHVKNPKTGNKRSSSDQKAIETYKQAEESAEEIIEQDHDGNTDNSDDETEFIQEEIIIKNEPEDEPQPKRVRYRKPRVIRPMRPAFKRHYLPRDRDRALAESYVKPSPTKGKDECDSFGEYIAVSLRKHDERTRSMIKQAINNILFEQEMKKYNNSSFIAEKNPLIIGDSDDGEK